MTVCDIMTSPVVVIEPTTTLPDAVALLTARRIRRLPVVENGRLVGIVTDRDLKEAGPSKATSLSVWELQYLLARTIVRDIMTRDVITLRPDDPVGMAATLMRERKIGGLPVVDGGAVIGIVTESDIFRCFARMLGAEPGYLEVLVGNTDENRRHVALLVGIPQLRTVDMGPQTHSIHLIFQTTDGLEETRQILRMVESLGRMKVERWRLADAPVAAATGG